MCGEILYIKLSLVLIMQMGKKRAIEYVDFMIGLNVWCGNYERVNHWKNIRYWLCDFTI